MQSVVNGKVLSSQLMWKNLQHFDQNSMKHLGMRILQQTILN